MIENINMTRHADENHGVTFFDMGYNNESDFPKIIFIFFFFIFGCDSDTIPVCQKRITGKLEEPFKSF